MGAAITLGVTRVWFAEYATGTGPAGMRDWARSLT